MRMLVFLMVTFILPAWPAAAVVSCFHHDLSAYGDLKTKVAEYADSPTHRETVTSYANLHGKSSQEIADSVAATGKLTCGKSSLTANLVLKNDIILTAEHIFVDTKTCKPGAKPQNCTFTAQGNPPIQVESMVATGNKCPTLDARDADWAILKLRRPVTGVVPYKLEEYDPREGINTRPVIAVGDHSVDFRERDPATGRFTYPKHIQDCNINRVFYRYDPVTVASNCDGSLGKSGGALLGANLADHVIVGMSVGTIFSDAEAQQEARTGVPIRKNFDRDKWFDAGVAIDGKLREELLKAAR